MGVVCRCSSKATAQLGEIDPDYAGKGMESFSKLDKKVFEEFAFDTHRLKKLADRIRQVADDAELPNKLYLIPEDSYEMEVSEGAVIYKLHKYRERDTKIIQSKKNFIWEREGQFLCEVCTFDFEQKYGELGRKYIECHHKIPLSDISGVSKTTLNDLALVCSNCHRMLHRKLDTLSVEGLKNLIA